MWLRAREAYFSRLTGSGDVALSHLSISGSNGRRRA